MKQFFESPLWILRLGLFAVFFWFGINEILTPFRWAGWVPPFVFDFFSFGFDSPFIRYGIMFHGMIAIAAAACMLAGRYVKFGAFIMIFVLALIIIPFGINEVTVRDIGLLAGAATLFIAYRHS